MIVKRKTDREPHFSVTLGDKNSSSNPASCEQQAARFFTRRRYACFATRTMSSSAREGSDFFPLSVDYEELYTGGSRQLS